MKDRYYNYPPQYLTKKGKLKKNYLKKAAKWRKEFPPKFLKESTLHEQITSKYKPLEKLLDNIAYPSYQHLNDDIINTFAEYILGNACLINMNMNSVEECELFRGFCVMNKRLCFLNKEFRKKYNIVERC